MEIIEEAFSSGKFSSQLLSLLKEESIDWAVCHGLTMRTKSSYYTAEDSRPESSIIHAPFTLVPSPFPKKSFHQAYCLGPDFNILVHKISCDSNFILDTLKCVSIDSFSSSLMEIFNTVLKEGIHQKIEVGIHRSDYMIHSRSSKNSSQSLKQVELNTISASFSNLSAFTSEMHRYLINHISELNTLYNAKNIPANDSLHAIPKALASAWTLYGNKDAYVMMIVHEGETNRFDQRYSSFGRRSLLEANLYPYVSLGG